LIPEKDRDVEHLFESLERTSRRNKTSRLVIVAEGDQNGSVYNLERQVQERFGDRYETKVTILGHVQRGGRPTCHDRVLASRLGVSAVEALMDGKRNVMIGTRNKKINFTDFDKATKQNPKMDEELIRVANIISI
jgi:6-phosphofructokinase 1